MYKTFIILLTTFFVFLSGCSNIKEQKFSSEVNQELIAKSNLSEEEKKLLTSAIDYSKKSNTSLEGKLVSDIILDEKNRLEEEKRKQEEERKRKEELERKEKERVEKIKNSLKVTLDNKKVQFKDTDAWRFSDVISFDLTFSNMTDSDIRAFSGTAVFKDVFGKDIKRLTLDYDEGTQKKGSKKWVGSMDVNQYMDNDAKLRDIEFQNLQFEFEIKTVIFKDGTRMDL